MEGDGCNSTIDTNLPHVTKPELVINCRNGWFREFWSQHNKCSFDNTNRKCTGEEAISDYEQEGLVPFVGKQCFIFSENFRIGANSVRLDRDSARCSFYTHFNNEFKF